MYAGTTGYVRIKNVGTTGDVLVDAVKFQALSKRLSQTTVYLAPTPEVYTYDADGNLTRDGKWNYVYDGENRLISMTSRNDETIVTPVAYRKKILFKYDYMGRWAAKATFDWDTDTTDYSEYTTTYTSFVYDGWNLMTELSSGCLARSYTWGPDLSGSLQGAGGIGGLVFVRDSGNSYYPAYDGNGNLTAMVLASSGAAVAKYEYSPYGELLTSTGSYASTNPFRFSTKYVDTETNLAYFGYRYYNPETGRWLNRDPIGEKGGVNLYAFVKDAPINYVDLQGNQGASLGSFPYNPYLPPSFPPNPLVVGPPWAPVPPGWQLPGTECCKEWSKKSLVDEKYDGDINKCINAESELGFPWGTGIDIGVNGVCFFVSRSVGGTVTIVMICIHAQDYAMALGKCRSPRCISYGQWNATRCKCE
jgi:RHS repeat-associated protein